jgi:hypothetical protein
LRAKINGEMVQLTKEKVLEDLAKAKPRKEGESPAVSYLVAETQEEIKAFSKKCKLNTPFFPPPPKTRLTCVMFFSCDKEEKYRSKNRISKEAKEERKEEVKEDVKEDDNEEDETILESLKTGGGGGCDGDDNGSDEESKQGPI